MCGRFTRTIDVEIVARRFGVAVIEVAAAPPRYNIAPTQPVIVVGDDGHRYLTEMHWGLIPSWAKDRSVGNRLINARAETLAVKPAFRAALRQRRCLVVADGFYEWQAVGRGKQPFYVLLKGREPFGFAALWDTWTSPEGETIRSCAIVTTEANELLKPIHDRMPAILTRDAEAVWLDPTIQERSILLSLLTPYPAEAMEVRPVSAWMNNPAHDSPACIEAAPPPGSPATRR
jgi:putative SOS response-associated peptidase YedK